MSYSKRTTEIVRLSGSRKPGLFRYVGGQLVEIDATEELRKIESQRDELLAALKNIESALNQKHGSTVARNAEFAHGLAVSAITKAEGWE